MGLCYRHEETRGLNELHQRGVHCGRNCALERSRRQLRRVPTMRSPLLPPVSLQLRLTCREGPTLSCCPVPLLAVLAVVSRILSILFESSSGLSLDLELFVLLRLCAWPPCHPPHTCVLVRKHWPHLRNENRDSVLPQDTEKSLKG